MFEYWHDLRLHRNSNIFFFLRKHEMGDSIINCMGDLNLGVITREHTETFLLMIIDRECPVSIIGPT